MLSINLSKIYHYSSEKLRECWELKLGLLGEKQECYVCAMQPPPLSHVNVSSKNLKESDSKELLGKGANS